MIRRHPVLVSWLGLALLSWAFQVLFHPVWKDSLHYAGPGGELAYRTAAGEGVPVLIIPGPGGLPAGDEALLAISGGRPAVALLPLRSEINDLDSLGRAAGRLVDSLDLQQVHVLAAGPLAAVALHMPPKNQQQFRSVVFGGAWLLEPYSLLGDQRFNNAVYSALEMTATAADLAIPHFGLLPFAAWKHLFHTMRSSDRSHHAEQLASLQAPVLFVHERHDAAAPWTGIEAAARSVRHPIIHALDGSPLASVARDPVLDAAPHAQAFYEQVEAGALPEPAATPAENPRFQPYGLAVVLIFVSIVLATFVTEDLTCFFAGVLAASGTVSFGFAVAACVTGLVVGDFGLYLLGRAGRRVLQKKPFSYFIPADKLARSGDWIRKNGPRVIFVSRFTPGMRTITYVSAGLLKAPALSFLFYFLLASLAWTPLLVGLSMLLGLQILPYFVVMEKHLLLVLVGVWILIWLVKSWFMPLFTWKGRRLVLSKFRRLYMWEFWPAWLFNIPTVLNWIVQGVRHRSLGIFSAVNPAIPHSGFVGESKIQILSAIGDKEAVARFCAIPFTLPKEEQFRLFKAFQEETGFGFPIVLKPDVGQRGAGVAIVRSDEEARAFFDSAEEDSIAQEFIPGEEFGVFYIRKPWEERGFIWSITEKKFTSVTGDGTSTLEELILRDDRTVCIAASMLRKFEDRLDYVPAAGEVFKLTELGNHYRGALFLDGERLNTGALLDRIDAIAKSYPGFYYGRFDIRVPSAADLAAGRSIKVLELNGITSEPTHIYQPGYSLLKGYRYLLGGWNHAFKIGAYNHRKAGAAYTTTRELLRLWFAFLAKPAR